MIVADASVLLDYLLRTAIEHEIRKLISENPVIAAPEIWSAEVLSGLRKQLLLGKADAKRVEIAVDLVGKLNIVSHAVLPMAKAILDRHENLTVYDASYVVLAEALSVPFYTRDKRLAMAPGHKAKIVLI